jgi:putative ABC transport system permease protein
MQEEMQSHMERATARLVQRGLSQSEARFAAQREFGNMPLLQEQSRDVRGGRWFETLSGDLHFGLRHFRRTPMATAIMIALLALGIGLNAAAFTLIYSMQTQPPPGIERDEDLVRIRGIARGASGARDVGREFPYSEYREYATQTDLFTAVAAWTSSDASIGTGPNLSILNSGAATFVTAGYFHVLGVRPLLGTGLPTVADEDASRPVAVISHALWERHLASAPDVIGQVIEVNNVAVNIVGVAPRTFTGARTGGSQVRVWLPLGTRPIVQPGAAATLASHDSALFGIAARLRPSIEPAQALAAVQAIAARTPLPLERQNLWTADVVPLRANNYFPPANLQSGESVSGRWFALLFPLLLLLIPCTNVSALLVGLAVARQREIGVRLALGAARARLVRQLLSETVLLALAGAVTSLFVIAILLGQLRHRVPDIQLVLHWPAIAFTLAIAIVAGIGFGITPALHATRVDVSDVLKNAATGQLAVRSRLQSAIVVIQIALTQPMLFALGALIFELSGDVRETNLAPRGDRVAELHFNTNPRYGALDSTREEALRRLQARLGAVPGVESVISRAAHSDYAEVSVHPADRVDGIAYEPEVSLVLESAPPGFFTLMGYRVVSGRDFSAREDPQALIVRAEFARRLFGGANPIGRQLVRGADGPTPRSTYLIVGVVDMPERGDLPGAFVASHRLTGSLMVGTRGPAQSLLPLIRSVALTEAPAHPITSITTLAALDARQRAEFTRAFGAAATAGAIALLISAIGLYAVSAFAVGQRTREIGIRSALGAGPQQVAGLFFRQGIRMGVAGVVAGLTLTWLVSRLMVIGGAIGPNGVPLSSVVLALLIAVVVVAVACLASWIPVRRAARVDPLAALRAE